MVVATKEKKEIHVRQNLVSNRSDHTLYTREPFYGSAKESNITYYEVQEDMQDVLSQMYMLQGKNG